MEIFEPCVYFNVPEGNGIFSDVLVETPEQEELVLRLIAEARDE